MVLAKFVHNIIIFLTLSTKLLLSCISGQAAVETIGSKRSYALTWCMPNNDDDDDV